MRSLDDYMELSVCKEAGARAYLDATHDLVLESYELAIVQDSTTKLTEYHKKRAAELADVLAMRQRARAIINDAAAQGGE